MIIDSPDISFLPELRALWKDAFGDTDEFLDDFEKTAFDTNRCRCVIENGKIASALYWFDCEYKSYPVAYLYAIATAREFRGRGLCRALIENTHTHLKNQGYYAVILVPGSKGLFSLYEKLGYRIFSYIDEFNLSASSHSVDMREIDADEYACLRRGFILENGVIQENENLKFLKTQASFYAGRDFLLTARREGSTLFGIELLGNKEAAPDILNSLGYMHGVFRAPGNKRPFAMYYSIKENHTVIPSYFGLAFD